jgi:hypothetical protein
MATQLSKTVDEATDQVISVIGQAQEAASSVVSKVSEAVADFVPELGLGETLLSPEEVVETGYRVGAKFMDAGKQATLGILEAVSPVTGKIFGSKKSPKPVVKSA